MRYQFNSPASSAESAAAEGAVYLNKIETTTATLTTVYKNAVVSRVDAHTCRNVPRKGYRAAGSYTNSYESEEIVLSAKLGNFWGRDRSRTSRRVAPIARVDLESNRVAVICVVETGTERF